jgi:hypothetical protein
MRLGLHQLSIARTEVIVVRLKVVKSAKSRIVADPPAILSSGSPCACGAVKSGIGDELAVIQKQPYGSRVKLHGAALSIVPGERRSDSRLTGD